MQQGAEYYVQHVRWIYPTVKRRWLFLLSMAVGSPFFLFLKWLLFHCINKVGAEHGCSSGNIRVISLSGLRRSELLCLHKSRAENEEVFELLLLRPSTISPFLLFFVSPMPIKVNVLLLLSLRRSHACVRSQPAACSTRSSVEGRQNLFFLLQHPSLLDGIMHQSSLLALSVVLDSSIEVDDNTQFPNPSR